MNDEFIQIIFIGIIFIIIVLVAVLIYMYLKEKKEKESDIQIDNKANDEQEEQKAKKSIFKFMEFDNIEDNMIVQDNGRRYLMIIECKGVNYDLLSGVEKNSIEQGFIGFLNTLKFEIQIYVQTRKVNLAQSTMRYRERLKNIERDMREEEVKYQDMQRSGNYTREELLKEVKEVTKKRNLYEYGRDIIENTEQMSEDKDLTTKEYYIIVPYYTEEITSAGDYDKREISSMAFSELYTRAQALVSALTECDVRGKTLNSQELVELLFIAYNREQHDIYDFEEYMSKSGYDSFYSVSEDVLEKRIAALDEEIIKKANEKAIEAYHRTNRKIEARRREIEDREKRLKEYVDAVAKDVVESQANVIGRAMAESTKVEIDNMTKEEIARKKKPKELKERKLREKQSNNESVDDNTLNITKTKETKKRELTEEEKRRRAILKKRKLLKEREEQKNGQK